MSLEREVWTEDLEKAPVLRSPHVRSADTLLEGSVAPRVLRAV